MKKLYTYLLFSLPLLYVVINVFLNDDIMNGPSYLIITTGYIALTLLVLILFMPIVSTLSDYIDRRSLGIITFIYALIHYLLYILDNNIEWMLIRNDLFFRNYIQLGYVALILFLPLVITSNNYAKELLGNKWIVIHRLIYIIILSSMLHYYMIIKADYFVFIIYSVILITIFIIKYRKYSIKWTEENFYSF